MFRNYLIIIFRNLKKHKVFSLINIVGLAVGLTVCFLIAIYIFHELNYDKFNENYENIYRIYIKGELTGQPLDYAVTMAPLTDALKQDFPEVKYATYINPSIPKSVVEYEDKQFFEDDAIQVTPDFFKVFSYRLLKGDEENVLKESGSIILTEDIAKKYFDETDPMGKTLLINNEAHYTVTGVCENPPSNSHFDFSAIISIEQPVEDQPQSWGTFGCYTYIVLNENINLSDFAEKLKILAMEKMGITYEETGMYFHLYLEPISDIYLHSNHSYDFGTKGNMTYIYVFSVIAIFILFIAYINFINLTTAHYSIRAKEIGVKKIVGAVRRKIVSQFLWESIAITLLAAILAFGFIELLIPTFNRIIGKELNLNFISHWEIIAVSIIFVIIGGIISGLYPAMYLSAFNPISVIKGNSTAGYKRYYFRNILVVFQFIISIALISSTLIIFKQVRYYQDKNLGFNKEQVMIVSMMGQETMDKALTIKSEFEDIAGVKSVSISSNFPGAGACTGHGFFPEGYDEEKPWLFKVMYVDSDFLKTFDIQLKQGRNFSKDFGTDRYNVIINETLAKEVGWEDAIGKTMKDHFIFENDDMIPITVIGVVNDFHVNPLNQKIEPLVLIYGATGNMFMSVKLEPVDVFKTIDMVEENWKELNPEIPLDYKFLDEHFDNIHRSERQLGKLFVYFTGLA